MESGLAAGGAAGSAGDSGGTGNAPVASGTGNAPAGKGFGKGKGPGPKGRHRKLNNCKLNRLDHRAAERMAKPYRAALRAEIQFRLCLEEELRRLKAERDPTDPTQLQTLNQMLLERTEDRDRWQQKSVEARILSVIICYSF